MPVRPENRARYPADWKDISLRIRARSGDACEFCGVADRAIIRRDGAVWRLASDSAYEDGRGPDGALVPDTTPDTMDYGDPVMVILTVAHLDHHPENCSDENLRALCQRCHNVYDAPHRAKTRRRTAAAKHAVADLFDDTDLKG